tara:strand:- start:1252 stop:1407 length:156 start_codon:yes stop_codon:yes gene_type:complete
MAIAPGRHFKVYVDADRKVKKFEPPIDLRTLEEKIKNIEIRTPKYLKTELE